MKTFFFFDFYQNNIVSNLTDALPGDDKFAVPAEKAEGFSGSRNYQSADFSCTGIKFNINGTAQGTAGTGINNLFLF